MQTRLGYKEASAPLLLSGQESLCTGTLAGLGRGCSIPTARGKQGQDLPTKGARHHLEVPFLWSRMVTCDLVGHLAALVMGY